MKLELKHLAPYLPYGLRAKNVLGKIIRIDLLHTAGPYQIAGNNEFNTKVYLLKPILHPLSDLTKYIQLNGDRFMPELWLKTHIMKTENYSSYDTSWIRELEYKPVEKLRKHGYWLFLKLHEWHFDVFDLIESGLAIDVNTLEVNPYE